MRRLARRLFMLCYTWPMPGLTARVGDELAVHLMATAKARGLRPGFRIAVIMGSGAILGIACTVPTWPSPPHGLTTRIGGFLLGFIPVVAVPLVYAKPRVVRELRALLRECGHCPACGFDLRASPGRCPECGEAAAPADSPG